MEKRDNQSVKGFVEAEEIAVLIVFITGSHGRRITGQALSIDGDSHKAS